MDYDAKKARIKPNSAEYQRIHRWVVKHLGKANKCTKDSSHEATRFDWSNISRDYLLDFSDWQQLCRACHRAYDGITDQGRESISEKNKVNSLGNTNAAQPVMCLDTKVSYHSARDASRSLGILATSIQNCLSGRSKTAGKLTWKYGRV